MTDVFNYKPPFRKFQNKDFDTSTIMQKKNVAATNKNTTFRETFDLTPPTDGDVIAYDSAVSQWVGTQLAGDIDGNPDDVTVTGIQGIEVDDTDIAIGKGLVYDGTKLIYGDVVLPTLVGTLTVAENVSANQVLTNAGYKASKDAYTTTYGLTKTSATTGHNVDCTIQGIHDNNTWSWTIGQPVFLSTAGALTQTAPTTGISIVIGYPVTTTRLLVRIETGFELL